MVYNEGGVSMRYVKFGMGAAIGLGLVVILGVYFVRTNKDTNSVWTEFEYKKEYAKAGIHFALSYPQEWQPIESGEKVTWVLNSNQEILTVSWLNPDVVYDVMDVCVIGKCDKVGEIKTSTNEIIEILKPTSERRSGLELPEGYLEGDIIDSQFPIVPKFSSSVLSIEDFKSVLVTFVIF